MAQSIEDGQLFDARLATSESQCADFWALREGVSEAQGALGKTIRHDIAVPYFAGAGFFAEADAAVAARWPDLRFVTFGHLGDGNVHYNFSPGNGISGDELLSRQADLNEVVHDIVAKHDGTISAEHGLGQLRHREAARYKSRVELAIMRTVKSGLDPKGIMNPGKLHP